MIYVFVLLLTVFATRILEYVLEYNAKYTVFFDEKRIKIGIGLIIKILYVLKQNI